MRGEEKKRKRTLLARKRGMNGVAVEQREKDQEKEKKRERERERERKTR